MELAAILCAGLSETFSSPAERNTTGRCLCLVVSPEGSAMTWLRIRLDEQQQRIVNAERDSHPQEHVRRKMLVMWLLHNGITREKAALIAGLGRATVQRYVAAFREGGLDGLRAWGHAGPVSDLAAHAQAIKQ